MRDLVNGLASDPRDPIDDRDYRRWNGPTREQPAQPTREQWHQQCEWEGAVAYEMGLRDGITLAAATINERVMAALTRPDGFGGPDLDQETRNRIMDMYRRYLGVGVQPEARHGR